MREIKFRAYEAETKTMFYNLDYITMGGGAFCSRPIIRPILMQYTGINDKNGREVYEGDIVRFYDYSNPLEVKFGEYEPSKPWLDENEELYGFYFNSHKTQFTYTIKDCNESIIIGNIYENPELLE